MVMVRNLENNVSVPVSITIWGWESLKSNYLEVMDNSSKLSYSILMDSFWIKCFKK